MPAEGQPASGGGCQVRRWQVNDDQSACLRTPIRRAIISLIAQLLPSKIARFITPLEPSMTTTAIDPQIVPRPPTAA